MNGDDNIFQRKARGAERIQIGPRISIETNKRLNLYALRLGVDKQDIVEVALREYLKDKDLTPVVQTQLPYEIETDYHDPRYLQLKELLEIARALPKGIPARGIIAKRIQTEYARVKSMTPPDTRLKVEVDAVMEMLKGGED